MWGTPIGDIRGKARSLDYGSHGQVRRRFTWLLGRATQPASRPCCGPAPQRREAEGFQLRDWEKGMSVDTKKSELSLLYYQNQRRKVLRFTRNINIKPVQGEGCKSSGVGGN